jgi:ABC-2 type transport system ATP-binding protein
MKQRLCLARALAHDPQLLILDEPASGLDPRARVEIRELLRELQAMGKTILVSSHILSEIQEVCTHIGIVEAGELVASGTLAEMRRMIRQQRVLHMGLARSVDGAGEWLAARDGVTGVEAVREQDMERVTLTASFTGDDDELVELLRAFTGAGYPLITCEEDIGDLEDIFMRLTRGIVS